jgi:hypothetical protein
VTFIDGALLHPTTVVWATGFGLDHSWIDAPIFDASGHLVRERGVTASPGLYFLGLPWQHTRGSALLGWVKDDAEYLAHRICATASPHRPGAALLAGTAAAVRVAAPVPASGTRTASPHARRLAGPFAPRPPFCMVVNWVVAAIIAGEIAAQACNFG